jgi:hypothetical protein
MKLLSVFLGLGVVLLSCSINVVYSQDGIFDPDAQVTIPDLGTMQGLTWLTYSLTNPRKFYVFHGIPYAKDTSVDKRFKVMRNM